MTKALNLLTSLASKSDLTTPTSTQKYPLGLEIKVQEQTTDGTQGVQNTYIYVKAHAALTAYQPYVINYTGTAAGEVTTGAPATMAAPGTHVLVPQVAFTSGYYGFVLKGGIGKVLMTAETYAVGDALQVLNTGTALVVDGSTGSAVISLNTCAFCREAGTTAVARDVLLLDRQAVVAAS